MALKHDTCIFPHKLHDNHSFKTRETCLLAVSNVDHSSETQGLDCNVANKTIDTIAAMTLLRVW